MLIKSACFAAGCVAGGYLQHAERPTVGRETAAECALATRAPRSPRRADVTRPAPSSDVRDGPLEMTNKMVSAIRVGCEAAGVDRCAYPDCPCETVPGAVKAAVTFAIKDAVKALRDNGLVTATARRAIDGHIRRTLPETEAGVRRTIAETQRKFG